MWQGAGADISGGNVVMLHTIFRSNSGVYEYALHFVSTTRPSTPWTNVTFIDNDKSVSASTPLPWHCPLGKYMPETGQHLGDFVGCKYDCLSGFYGDSPTLVAAHVWTPCSSGESTIYE